MQSVTVVYCRWYNAASVLALRQNFMYMFSAWYLVQLRSNSCCSIEETFHLTLFKP